MNKAVLEKSRATFFHQVFKSTRSEPCTQGLVQHSSCVFLLSCEDSGRAEDNHPAEDWNLNISGIQNISGRNFFPSLYFKCQEQNNPTWMPVTARETQLVSAWYCCWAPAMPAGCPGKGLLPGFSLNGITHAYRWGAS